MNPKYTHDFSSASIKHLIEAEFYQKVGEKMSKGCVSSTIVTGPDFQRHIDNFNKYINRGNLRICETNMDIFIDIYRGCVPYKNINVVNDSVDMYGSSFVDCDLTCTSDLRVIKKTLLKQIDVHATAPCSNKIFIFSFSTRTTAPKPKESYFRPIFGLLGANISKVTTTPTEKIKGFHGAYLHRVSIDGTKGRIKEYICYEYNAGGGPMLTCLIIYK